MTQLEQTIIERARGYLAGVRAFYAKVDQADEHDREDFQNNHAGLTALLEFGHMNDCGMSPEGQAELLAIEADAAAAIPRPASANLWPRGGQGKTSDVNAVMVDYLKSQASRPAKPDQAK
jgi:hypothetical protein